MVDRRNAHIADRVSHLVGDRPYAIGDKQPCPHYPDCVGCTLIGTPYGAQLRIKRERVAEAFRPFATLAGVAVPEVIGSPRAFGYRNQSKLVVRRTRRELLLGIYRPGSHQVVDIRQCPVHHPLIARVLDALPRLIERHDISTYDERTHAGSLRYIVVRVSTWTKQAQVIGVTAQRHATGLHELARGLRRVPGVVSVVQNVNGSPGNAVFGEQFIALTPVTTLTERIGSLRLKTSAGAFLQANVPVGRKLYQEALAWLEPSADDTVVDLHSGVGALTFCLATAARHVFGIEASPIAVADAKTNVRLNGFHNVRFIQGDAAVALAQLAQRLPRVDALALNPPRKGTDEACRRAIVAAHPQRLVYVSCDPGSLARDLDWFAVHGYPTRRVQPFDMMPQSEHVECIAELVRAGRAL